MSKRNSRPDERHQPEEVDDLDFIDEAEVPTYSADDSVPTFNDSLFGTANSESRPSIYERAGRAAPQEIPPARPEPQPTEEVPATTAFPAAEYQDEDFAQPSTDEPIYVSGAEEAPEPQASEPVYVGDGIIEDSASAESVPVIANQPRGTLDFGLLIARVVLAAWLILEALSTFFHFGGSGGIAELEAAFGGYAQASVLAVGVPTLQLAAGVFILFGLATPVAAAIAITVNGFMALHSIAFGGVGFNVFQWSDETWLAIALLGFSVVLQFTGPGLYSLDFARSWVRRPRLSSWIGFIVAAIAVVVIWFVGTGINPFA